MSEPIPLPSSLDVIVKIIDALLQAIGTKHRIGPVALLVLIEPRLREIRELFVSLLARLRADIPAREGASGPAAARPATLPPAAAPEPGRGGNALPSAKRVRTEQPGATLVSGVKTRRRSAAGGAPRPLRLWLPAGGTLHLHRPGILFAGPRVPRLCTP